MFSLLRFVESKIKYQIDYSKIHKRVIHLKKNVLRLIRASLQFLCSGFFYKSQNNCHNPKIMSLERGNYP